MFLLSLLWDRAQWTRSPDHSNYCTVPGVLFIPLPLWITEACDLVAPQKNRVQDYTVSHILVKSAQGYPCANLEMTPNFN